MKANEHRHRTAAALAGAVALAAAFFAFGAHGSHAATESGSRAPAVVSTSSGAVRGVVTGAYRVFNGIPYAAPPVGQLRWRAPQPQGRWSGVRDATTPGPDCVQTAVAWRPAAASTDEDCLSVNVTTPSELPGGHGLPVAVWFYGGGFINGAARDFRPVAFVQHDAIVVTVNYRLGAMGYLSLPGLDQESGTSGNYGLLDQIQALRWVRANARSFGGDPSKVMIAGQSAGAESVCALLASPKAAGLFSRAVIESGLKCAVNTKQAAQSADEQFAASLGCTGSPDAVVACLRSKPAVDILDAQQHSGAWRPDIDGTVLPMAPDQAFSAGSFNRVPVVIGGTAHEARAFVYEQNDLINHPVTASQYLAKVQSTYGPNAAQVLSHYPLSQYSAPGAALAAVQTDSGFSCPELQNAASLSHYIPTYVYEFRDETAPLRPYELVPSSFSLATQHSSELPYLWGSNTATPLTSTQQRLSGDMIEYWRQFAAAGDLSVPGLPQVPRYDPAGHAEVALDSDGPRIVTDMAAAHQCSFWDSLPSG